MSVDYREHAPSQRLAPYVERLWTLETATGHPGYAVLPDGCEDIVFSSPAMDFGALRLIGSMTQAQRFGFPAGQTMLGIRFRPGMSRAFLRVPGRELVDRSVPLEDALGPAAKHLSGRLQDLQDFHKRAIAIDAWLGEPRETTVVQRLCEWIVRHHGCVRVEDLSRHAGFSSRQLRRLFLDQTGLTPKQFCRVIRFRRSLSRLRASQRGEWTQTALECGYYDQAHFINDFREFSGLTPGEFTASRVA
jgi:AraC-like DNA-binding protein